jgi:hypothetical protein
MTLNILVSRSEMIMVGALHALTPQGLAIDQLPWVKQQAVPRGLRAAD